MADLRVLHVAPIRSGVPTSGVGGVGAYMLSLLNVLSGRIANTVLCNDDADVQSAQKGAPSAAFVPTWTFGSIKYPIQIFFRTKAELGDIIHIQHELFLFGPGSIALCFPLLLFLLRKRKNVVITVHGVVTEVDLDESLMRGRRSVIPFGIIRRLILSIFRSIAKSGAHKIVHSDELRKRLVTLGAVADSITVIDHPLSTEPLGISLSKAQARAALRLPSAAPTIISWGYWNSYKGHAVLVDGFRLFRQSFPEARLLLGAGPHPQLKNDLNYRREYEATMSEFAGVEGVEVLGYIESSELPQFVRASDVSVFAYTKYLAASGPASYSLSLGTPVLLSAVFGDAPEQLQFQPTAGALAQKLVEFFKRREEFEAASAALAERASADALRTKYFDVYRALAGTNSW